MAAALLYAGKGYQVIPLHSPSGEGCSCKSAACNRVGKHPRTQHGLKDASTSPTQIRKWFERWPDANVGIVTGSESGLVVLDVDDGGVMKGSDALAALLKGNGDATTTMMVRTGNGWHIYYRHPGGTVKNSVGSVGTGLDIRADGGYVVAAPSRHANGTVYTVDQEAQIEGLPIWLDALIGLPDSKSNAIAVIQSNEIPMPDKIVEGSRNSELFKIACRLRGHQGMEQRDLERVLTSYNQELCQEPLAIGEVLQIADSACRYPAERSAERSLNRQGENPLWWYRFNVRTWFSDQNVASSCDYQIGWRIRLINFAWDKGGYLTSDPKLLWRLAGAKSCAFFVKHCDLALVDFDLLTEHDGTVVLRHRFMAAEYAETIKKWMNKVKGGEVRAQLQA